MKFAEIVLTMIRFVSSEQKLQLCSDWQCRLEALYPRTMARYSTKMLVQTGVSHSAMRQRIGFAPEQAQKKDQDRLKD